MISFLCIRGNILLQLYLSFLQTVFVPVPIFYLHPLVFLHLKSRQSFPQVSNLPFLSCSLLYDLDSCFFFLPSSLSLLVISTCQTKEKRQMDRQMNTQIYRGGKEMME